MLYLAFLGSILNVGVSTKKGQKKEHTCSTFLILELSRNKKEKEMCALAF